MKRALSLFLTAITCASSAQLVSYNPTNNFNYRPDPSYTRDEYDWWVHNTHSESRLSRNGVYQSSESGTNDIGLLTAWAIQPSAVGVTVGLVDIGDGHGRRMMDLITNTAPGATLLFRNIGSYTPFNVSQGIDWMRTNGAQIIVIGYGTSANDSSLSNACWRANAAGIPLLVPMREDGSAFLNVDSFSDYPSSYAATMPHLIPVTGTDRTGKRHPSTGYGTNTIAAPFRNIIADGNYESGTSFSAPIAAGCLALIAARYPNQKPNAWVSALLKTAIVIPGSRRINPTAALSMPILSLSRDGILKISGVPETVYVIEYSENLETWADLFEFLDGTEIQVDPGFYRARVK